MEHSNNDSVIKYYTIPKIAKKLDVAGNTIRRDIYNRFPEFFESVKTNRFDQYTEEAVDLLTKIYKLRKEGVSKDAIKKQLLDDNYKTYDINENINEKLPDKDDSQTLKLQNKLKIELELGPKTLEALYKIAEALKR